MRKKYMTVVQICILCIIGIALFHFFSSKPQGCNVEDDDIRRDALMAKLDRKKKDRQDMKQYLTEVVQDHNKSG